MNSHDNVCIVTNPDKPKQIMTFLPQYNFNMNDYYI